MKNANQTTAVLDIDHIEPQDLLDSLEPRSPLRTARAGIRAARKQHHAILAHRRQAIAAYRGGVVAEQQSLAALSAKLHSDHLKQRQAVRAAYLGREGRPIDLESLMTQLDSTGTPVWAIADPREEIGGLNGATDHRYMGSGFGFASLVYWPSTSSGNYWLQTNDRGSKSLIPSGIPALPKRVRQLISDPKIQRRAHRIGILYQPETWTQHNPDPALVVEWKDLPGKYFALAVWGGDRARIMEWVS